MNCNECKNYEPKVTVSLMTDEPHLEILNGSTFRMANDSHYAFKTGDVLTLQENDGSVCPYFITHDPTKPRSCNWKYLEPISIIRKEPALPRLPKIGDWVEAKENESGGIIEGEKYQIISAGAFGRVYVRSPFPSHFRGDNAKTKIKQPFSCLSKYTLLPDYVTKDDVLSTTTYRGKQYRDGEPHPEIPIGTKFRVVDEGDYFHKGEIITLIKNDGTDCPQFSNGKKEWYLCWCRLEPVKRVYTAEQIREAKDIVYGLMTSPNCVNAVQITILKENFLDCLDRPNKNRPHTVARLLTMLDCEHLGEWREDKRAVAICSDNDEWNDDIGRMVALSKLLGEPLPKWVRGE